MVVWECDVDSGSIIMKGQFYPNMVVMTIGYEHANHIPLINSSLTKGSYR